MMELILFFILFIISFVYSLSQVRKPDRWLGRFFVDDEPVSFRADRLGFNTC